MSIKPQEKEMAALVKEMMTINGEGVVALPEDYYERTLPANDPVLNMETLKAHQAHNSLVMAGTLLAVGDVALPVFKDNADLKTATYEYQVGADAVNGMIHRTKEFNAGANSEEKVTKYGHAQVKYQVRGAENKGQLRQVYLHLQDEWAATLAD